MLEIQGLVEAGTRNSWPTRSEGQRGWDPVERGCGAGSHHPLGCMELASLNRDLPFPRVHFKS